MDRFSGIRLPTNFLRGGRKGHNTRIQVLGLIRFSLPAIINGPDDQDVDANRKRLYDPGRLERRLLWLERVVLPGLAKQTDSDFKVVLLAGDRFPEPFRTRLEGLVARVRQIEIDYREEGGRTSDTCRKVMADHTDATAHVVADFRLDDDDAVAADFVARTRKHFESLEGLYDTAGRATLDFCRGMLMRVGRDGVEVRPVLAEFWTPALVTYRRPGNATAIRSLPHLKLWQHMPTLSLHAPVMFVRGAHEDNTSKINNRWASFDTYPVDPKKIPRLFRTRFGIDLKAFERDHRALEDEGLATPVGSS